MVRVLMSAGQIALLAVILTASGFVSGLSGFGYFLAATPLCSIVVAPARAVILITVCGLAPAIQDFLRFRRDIDRPVATRMTIASLVGMPLGLVVLETIGDAPLRLTIAVVTGTVTVLMLTGVELRRATRTSDVLLGFLSGVLNTSVGTNGPPMVINLRAHQLSISRFRGTISTLFVTAQVVAVILFASRGKIHLDVVLLALAVVPVQMLFVLAGQRLSLRLAQRRFDHVVLAVLLASAIGATINAVVNLATG
ncbi:MAG: TSUP family transporter [Actinobacteria bacterium]|nr:TSUP family transporter [Actinomycetota bacterium]